MGRLVIFRLIVLWFFLWFVIRTRGLLLLFLLPLLQLLLLLLVLLFELFQLPLLVLLHLLIPRIVLLIAGVVVLLVAYVVVLLVARRVVVLSVVRPIVPLVSRIVTRLIAGINARRICGPVIPLVTRIFIFLLEFLLLLHLLLLDFLPFAILLLAKVFKLLLVLLFELRIHLGALRRRPVVVPVRIALIAAVTLNVVIGNRLRPIRIPLLRRTILLNLILLIALYRLIHLILLVLAIFNSIPVIVLRLHLARGGRDANILPCRLSLHLTFFIDADWPSAIRLNRLLLARKRYRRRRRCRLGHNRPVGESSVWSYASFRAGAQHAALLRDNGWTCRCHRSCCNFPLVHADHVASNRLSGGKRRLRSGGYRVVDMLVLVGDVRDVHRFVHVNVVVDVCDLRAIHDDGVRNVHAFDVSLADAIGRAIYVTRAQREPCHTNGRRSAHGNSDAPMRAANPGD